MTIGWLVSSCGSDGELPASLSHFESELPERIDYNFHVKPILSDRCFNCHGPDKDNLQAGLRLDQPESAFAELVDHPGKYAIVSGQASRSELTARILSDDPELVMPPADSKLSLSDQEKAVIIKWINQGAEYKAHWAFQSLKVDKLTTPKNPVDYYIDQGLEKRNFASSPQASRESLIRRLAFDVTGLPPTLTEIDAFISDSSINAYEKIIDVMLAKPSYGERMAADWMDVARYADSDGYLDDKHREFSPWRDWVVNSFNKNMPYDQFVTWQIAGDLIENRSQESVLATAFNRLHRKNSEAGIVFEEYRVEYVADRVNTFSKAFLGLTLECARCHDHKYDPITQEEYYQMFSFFNSTNEIGTAVYGPKQTPGPALLLTSAEQDKVLDFINEQIVKQENRLSEIEEEVNRSDFVLPFSAVDGNRIRSGYQKKLVAHHTFDNLNLGSTDKRIVVPNNANSAKPGAMNQPLLGDGIAGDAFYVDDYNYVLLGDQVGWYDRQDPFAVSLWLKPAEVYPQAGIFTHCEDIRLGYKGYSLHLQENHLRFIMAYSWPTNAIEIISDTTLKENEWSQVVVSYDGSSRAEGVQLFLNGKPITHSVVADNLYKGILFEPDLHTYGFQGFRLGYRDKIKPFKGGAIDEVKVFSNRLSALEVLYAYQLQKNGQKQQLSPEHSSLVKEYVLLNENATYQKVLDELYTLRSSLTEEINDIKEIMVMGDLPEPRPTFLLRRGMYDAHGQEVTPGVPKALGEQSSGYAQNRLGLAQWLFAKENPLTARVFVNRIWQQFFGRGLVKTAEDFGAQGALPTHPELLDYLAHYFIESGWDIKHLQRLILTSAAYQRSSVLDSNKLLNDPENIWLARGPSQRLSAEMTRDNVLAISGLLVDKQGGPSTYPYQPAGLWDEISNKSWRYPYLQEPGDGLYRRSLYTIWKRSSPPPSMLLFDVPDRSFCTVQRRETSTPLQALVLLNDPQYVEASREIAERAWTSNENIEARLVEIFRLTIGRLPSEKERYLISEFYHSELMKIKAGEINIQEYFSNGERPIAKNIDAPNVAALAMTTHNLLNSYEAQMKK